MTECITGVNLSLFISAAALQTRTLSDQQHNEMQVSLIIEPEKCSRRQ